MKFYHLKDTHAYENDMTTMNKYKIRQFKTTENLVEIDPVILDLIIVPGMAFSQGKDKYRRIGRGKGYYDRYLSRIPGCFTIGLCFNQQFIPNDYTNLSVPSVYGQDFEVNELLCENTII
jgi:5,10-methenyltetrahydrofolate synthetase